MSKKRNLKLIYKRYAEVHLKWWKVKSKEGDIHGAKADSKRMIEIEIKSKLKSKLKLMLDFASIYSHRGKAKYKLDGYHDAIANFDRAAKAWRRKKAADRRAKEDWEKSLTDEQRSTWKLSRHGMYVISRFV